MIARISPRLIEQENARHESHTAMPGASTRSRRTISIGVIYPPASRCIDVWLNDEPDPARQ